MWRPYLLSAGLFFFATALHAPAAYSPPLLVILDPGHGGEDTGAVRKLGTRTVSEKDLTLAIALKTQQALSARGIPSVLTRQSDAFVPLDVRTGRANTAATRAQNAIFVSIHVNSDVETRGSSASGVETYIFNASSNEAAKRLADLENGKFAKNGKGTVDLILTDLSTTANHADSLGLACSVQKSVVRGLRSGRRPTRDRGIRQALFYVLMQAQMPSILFEPGFMNNTAELERLADPRYQRLVAAGLASGIAGWRDRPARPCSIH